MTIATVLRTARTVLRPLEPANSPALHALWTVPGVRRYLWDDDHLTLVDTTALVELSVSLHRAKGLGLWGARPVAGGDLIGFAGYWYFHEPPMLELVFGVAEPHWGRGYATEIAGALVGHGFYALDLAELRAGADTANVASRRVLAKLGFHRALGAASDDSGRCAYALTRVGWSGAR